MAEPAAPTGLAVSNFDLFSFMKPFRECYLCLNYREPLHDVFTPGSIREPGYDAPNLPVLV